ncbi:transposable element Tc1 transposase [Elysia marginata]|uniref:Transposable element Tc1 transposase n=1 Tax=Elysia marginata TaxID=1093978 RepID=A0AAV4JIK8_9GAST|nr:transposable element Tc1 transposase [Elysia marginata]
MPRLSEVDRHRALRLLQAGLPISEVSLRMNVNRKTIFRLRQRLHVTDTVRDRPRSGSPRCTSQRQDRNLVRIIYEQQTSFSFIFIASDKRKK